MIEAPKTWLVSFFDEVPFEGIGTDDVSAARLLTCLPWRRGLSFGAPILDETQVIASTAENLAPLIRLLTVISEYVDVVGRAYHSERLADCADGGLHTKKCAMVRALAVMLNERHCLSEIRSDDEMTAEVSKKLLMDLGKAFLSRRYLFGNPLVGLTLNYACVRIDTRILIEVLPMCFGENPSDSIVETLLQEAQEERVKTIGTIAALSFLRDDSTALEKSAAIWQVRHLGLPRSTANRLVQEVSMPPSLEEVGENLPQILKTRLYINVLIAAVIDGRLSNQEKHFLESLGKHLSIPVVYQKRLIRRFSSFVREHRRHLNPLEHAVTFEQWGAPLQVRIARRVRKHLAAVIEEIRETGDLAVLLGKKARGVGLSETEEARMREQLLDVVRVVPGLAVFSLPGGVIILPILLKLLPFDLRPSAFRSEDFHAFEGSGKMKISAETNPKSMDSNGGSSG